MKHALQYAIQSEQKLLFVDLPSQIPYSRIDGK